MGSDQPSMMQLPALEGAAPNSFTRTGRVAITVREVEKPNQSVALLFELNVDAGEVQLRLSAPTGGDVALVTANSLSAQATANGKTWQGATAREVLRTASGIDVPVEPLIYWVTGHPASKAASIGRSEAGRLKSIDEQGWRVEYIAAPPGTVRLIASTVSAGQRIELRVTSTNATPN